MPDGATLKTSKVAVGYRYCIKQFTLAGKTSYILPKTRNKRKPESEMTELEKLCAENRMQTAKNKRMETENAVLKLEEIERRWC